MKRAVVVGLLCGVLVLGIGAVVLAATGAITDQPNTVMNWIVTAVATVVAVPLVNWLKKAIPTWVGVELGGKLNQFVSWIVCYVIALIGYLIGGLVTGVSVWSTVLASGWAIFASGSAVSILANLAYNIWTSAKGPTV
jgi:hypothetical protein